MFPYFVVSDTNYDSITSLLATRIIYFGPFRGVMKIRIAVTLVVLGLLYTYIHGKFTLKLKISNRAQHSLSKSVKINCI